MADRQIAQRSVKAPWGAWTGDVIDLPVPATWRLVQLPIHDAPALSAREIDLALDRPVGALPLSALAANKRHALIAVDDITRPTRTAPVVSRLVATLRAAGIPSASIEILLATGAHRSASGEDIRLKVGELPEGVRVGSHDAVNDVEPTDAALAGQSVRINRKFLAADVRITVGGVMAHPFAGFSGGGKMVLPGLADLDTVVRSHKYALMGFGGGLALEGNKFRIDMERSVSQLRLDWTVNIVQNARCDIAAIVAGDPVAAHRAAAARAQRIGATAAPSTPLDALVLNAYPKDSELLQLEAALVAVRAGMTNWLAPNAPIALLGACPDGLGSHQLFGPGGRLFRKPTAKAYLEGRVLHVVSPATAADRERAVFWDGYPYHTTWEGCVAALHRVLPPSPVVGFAMSGPLHVPLPMAADDGPTRTRATDSATEARA